MENLKKEIIIDLLNSLKAENGEEFKNSLANIEEYLNSKFYKKAVLGFDIYRYSKFINHKQTLIPILFKKLFEITILNCIECEKTIFGNKKREDFEKNFIDTGDGGFLIFDNPIYALIFAFYFQSNIKRYNSGHGSTLGFYKVIGEITLRYSLTYDNIYKYDSNFYGTSIINNARIMSKDKLNRFLVDENVVIWFNQEINGIENLQAINVATDLKNIECLKINGEKKVQSLIFSQKKSKILRVDIQHIGEISSKGDVINIHSLHIQYTMESHTSSSSGFKKYTVSLGNLNSSGLV